MPPHRFALILVTVLAAAGATLWLASLATGGSGGMSGLLVLAPLAAGLLLRVRAARRVAGRGATAGARRDDQTDA